jgi:hypothetical protein
VCVHILCVHCIDVNVKLAKCRNGHLNGEEESIGEWFRMAIGRGLVVGRELEHWRHLVWKMLLNVQWKKIIPKFNIVFISKEIKSAMPFKMEFLFISVIPLSASGYFL